MEHLSNIFSTSFGINFAKLTHVWLALISLTAKINSLLIFEQPCLCLKHERKHVDAGTTTPTPRPMNAWFRLFTCFLCVFTISRNLRRILPAC